MTRVVRLLLFALCAMLPPVTEAVTTAEILQKYDSGDFAGAAALLSQMKSEQPEAYEALPYALLRARALQRAGDAAGAQAAYEAAAGTRSLSRFALLPLARLSASRSDAAAAARAYQQYLSLRSVPDYAIVAREALDYFFQQKKPDLLRQTAGVVRQQSAFRRLADLYTGKSYALQGQAASARSLYQDLIRKEIKDDVSSMALIELDALEGATLDEARKVSRGKFAYRVWNFELARKYLEPYALRSMDNAYYYARALSYLGQGEAARKTYQAAIGLWPQDRMVRICIYQYANLCLRQGDNQKAAELYSRVRPGAGGDILESATFSLVQALRAQSKLNEALDTIRPYCASRKRSTRERALFLRARIYFQGAKFREALTDINQLLNGKPSLNRKELLFWKALLLQKLGMQEDADQILASIATGDDFFAAQVRDELIAQGRKPPETVAAQTDPRMCRLPSAEQEPQVLQRAAAGDMLTPFLYIHLYAEAAGTLPSITQDSSRILGIDPANREDRLLATAYLAGLGHNYVMSTYYAEVFLKTLPSGVSVFGLPPDVQHALFPFPYKDLVRKYADERKVDPYLVISIMKQESKFKEAARSQAFARGLMQLIPSTAAQIASSLGMTGFSIEQLYQPQVNINLGTRYVQDMVAKFGPRVEVIAASYNSGEANVRRWLSIMGGKNMVEFYSNIDLPETKNYVSQVRTNYEFYRRIYP